MTTYTEKDFANARFAVHPDPETVNARYAARMSRDPEFPWLLDGVLGNGDEHMVQDGWVPVVEPATHERTVAELRYDLTVAREERDRLSRQLVVAEEQIKSRGLMLEDFLEENDRLKRNLQEPLSLKDLQVAWEAAYEEEECRKGDVLMTRHSDDNYEVWVSVEAFDISKKTRVLSRAPREPWEDLADDLADRSALMGEGIIEAAAKALHLAGWRKTGGDDDE